jgi:nucleotidyltransferase/DNA polymerase involved in DNA repair
MTNQKYIALVDCDSFFVSCERKLNPELNGLPVSVVSGERGCVIARSREAKAMGVPMGIPLFQAVEKYPGCIYVTVNHYAYSKISKSVMTILKEFSPNVQIYSIDEAFVDFTGLTKLYKKNYYNLGCYLQKKVWDEVGIPVTIGISSSKTLSKLASDKAKNSETRVALAGKQTRIPLLKKTEIDEVWGIGRRLGVKLKGYGVRTAYDFTQKDDEWIKKRFGKNGLTTKAELLGIMISPISSEVELPKSISDSKSFPEFSSDINYLKNELSIHVHSCCKRLRKIDCKCSTIGVLLKTKDFRSYYDKEDLDFPLDFEFDISKVAFEILNRIYSQGTLYRSIGVVFENFNHSSKEQLILFDDGEKREKNAKLGKSLDILEKKFGRNIVRTGFVDEEVPFKQGFLTSPQDVE